jgi:hypothetical protein
MSSIHPAIPFVAAKLKRPSSITTHCRLGSTPTLFPPHSLEVTIHVGSRRMHTFAKLRRAVHDRSMVDIVMICPWQHEHFTRVIARPGVERGPWCEKLGHTHQHGLYTRAGRWRDVMGRASVMYHYLKKVPGFLNYFIFLLNYFIFLYMNPFECTAKSISHGSSQSLSNPLFKNLIFPHKSPFE